ncbi:MAG: 30S ribosomal protein S15 [Candidatus Diapherotrites archaeon]|nr:30S ribosomal protein S15 [Candidatus Diapherotrites archaeon]
MARMHSGAKGKSKSKKPVSKKAPAWVELKPKELEEAIVNLANAGHSAAEIGGLLRDQYGVPSVKQVTGKTVSQLLEQHELGGKVPEDLMNLIKKSVKQRQHMQKNKKDFDAKRGYQLSVSKIRRLINYYKKRGKLPGDWRYTEERAELLAK